MRWGIVGPGRIARGTVRDLQAVDGVELVAVASRSADTAAAFAAEYGVPLAFGGYDALFGCADVDVVYVCTPHGTHTEQVRAALLAGKHVLCEKSLTVTAAQARELAELARDRGRFLMEAMWTRFNPATRRLLDELAAGVVGEPRTVHAAFGVAFPYDETSRIWRHDLGGGALLDLGVYPLTLAHLVLGRPDGVRAVGDIRPDGVDRTASVLLDYADGRLAHALTSITGTLGATAVIGGTTGFVTVDPPFHASDTYRVHPARGEAPAVVSVAREGRGYVPMFRAVDEAVAAGLLEHPWRPLRDTIEVLDTMDEIRRQLLAGAPPGSPVSR